MSEEALRLTVYFGERDRAGSGLLADALMDLLARRRVRASALLRGIEGFGIKHRLATERLLTLSEDLPLVAVAVDTPPRIEAVLEEARELSPHGALTLERARLLDAVDRRDALDPGSDAVKLTCYLGRGQRIGTQAAYVALVDCLHRHGVAGASVLLGLDGTLAGARRRARFFGRNAQVPLMVESVGEAARIERALGEIAPLLAGAALTVERVRVCKRDGVTLSEPPRVPSADAAGRGYWQKLVCYTSERDRHGGQPLHSALVRALRREGAAGATALRGQWGYHGEHRPHGEALWSLSRHVPVLSTVLDTPANTRRWFAILDELTAESGLVTSELVPALRAAGPGVAHGGLRLAAAHGRSPG
ncbi:MAG TPA: DUF190 domain-containing protein [Solirubrobacteraceae bacterium]|nr:DUF190 domain-containing protein [Solirubrobacteraceae bacterium]